MENETKSLWIYNAHTHGIDALIAVWMKNIYKS